MSAPTSVQEAVARQFGPAAAAYAASQVHAAGEDLAALAAAAKLSGCERVLDAGCGAGHASLAVAPYAVQVTAYDLSPDMLAQTRALAAERGLSNIVTRQGDVAALPFAAGEFDAAVSRYSAHHWPDPAAALSEIARVLRPGGRFVLSDIVSEGGPVADSYLQALELLRDPSHVRDHTPAQWLAMLEGAGFAAELLMTWGVWLHFADWTARMATPPVQVAALHALLDAAPAEVRAALAVEEGSNFTLRGALFRAVRRG